METCCLSTLALQAWAGSGELLYANDGVHDSASANPLTRAPLTSRMIGFDHSGQPWLECAVGPPRVWYSFLSGLDTSARAEVCRPDAHPKHVCGARAIHEFNIWSRALRLSPIRVYEHMQPHPSTDPTFVSLLQSYANVVIKLALHENVFLKQLDDMKISAADRAIVKSWCALDYSTRRSFSMAGPTNEEVKRRSWFLHARRCAVLEFGLDAWMPGFAHARELTSWALWAVYGDQHGALIEALLQVFTGLMDLTTLVPRRLEDNASPDWAAQKSARFVPLQEWLRDNQDMLGTPIIRLFFRAAGATDGDLAELELDEPEDSESETSSSEEDASDGDDDDDDGSET